MEVGISSACFYPMQTEDAIDQIIRCGFRNVEIFVNSECEYHPTYCKELRKKLDDGGVNVVSLHSYTAVIESLYFFSGYERRIQDALDAYRRYFEAAATLGAKYFSFHGERAPHQIGFGGADFDTQCAVLCRLSDVASEYGITVTQENVSWCASSDPNYIRGLRDALGNKIGFTLDLKQARRVNVPWQEYADAMGDRLLNIHISDTKDKKLSMLPGEGAFDFAQFFQYLKGKSYSNCVVIEVYSNDFGQNEQLIGSKQFLEKQIAQKID